MYDDIFRHLSTIYYVAEGDDREVMWSHRNEHYNKRCPAGAAAVVVTQVRGGKRATNILTAIWVGTLTGEAGTWGTQGRWRGYTGTRVLGPVRICQLNPR